MSSSSFKKIILSRRKLLASTIGLILGTALFLNVSDFIFFIAGSLFSALLFLLLETLLEKIWERDRSGFLKTGGLLLVALAVPLILIMFGTTCLMAFYSLDYNPINDKCTVNTYTCNVERPWYQSECKGEHLEDYCERQNFSSPLDRSERNLGPGMIGYSKCKDAGYIEQD